MFDDYANFGQEYECFHLYFFVQASTQAQKSVLVGRYQRKFRSPKTLVMFMYRISCTNILPQEWHCLEFDKDTHKWETSLIDLYRTAETCIQRSVVVWWRIEKVLSAGIEPTARPWQGRILPLNHESTYWWLDDDKMRYIPIFRTHAWDSKS